MLIFAYIRCPPKSCRVKWIVLLLLLQSVEVMPAKAVQNKEGEVTPLNRENLAPADSGISHITTFVSASDTGEKASISLKINDLVSPYQTLGVFVMPGEKIDLETIFMRPGETYSIKANDGEVKKQNAGAWSWVAPLKPGAYTLHVEGPHEFITLNVFVKTAFDNENPVVGDYQIGSYESEPLRKNPLFNQPAGLIEVNEATAKLSVSPHFTLGAFASHQPGNPKFLLLDERLVLKLEMLLEEVRKHGIEATTFIVMSGYRTPWYNKQIGNDTRYSLHLYGRAADIYIDEDRDGRMDDLNNDGRIDIKDARVLFDIAEKMDQQPWYQPFIGGLGLYGPKPHRGPFVHVDVRGYTARW